MGGARFRGYQLMRVSAGLSLRWAECACCFRADRGAVYQGWAAHEHVVLAQLSWFEAPIAEVALRSPLCHGGFGCRWVAFGGSGRVVKQACMGRAAVVNVAMCRADMPAHSST